MRIPISKLSPEFLRYESKDLFRRVGKMAEANGVCFLCPLCYERNGFSGVGVHNVICWSKSGGVPDDAIPGPGRWRLVGAGITNLTLAAEPGKSRSVLLIGGCGWHGFVTDGVVT